MPPAEKLNPSKKGVQVMKLNHHWWWGSISGDLENVEYPFTVITPRLTINMSGNTGKDHIYG